MSDDILSQLKWLIAEKLDVDLVIEEIDERAPLIDGGLSLDSVATIELISLIEGHFDFEFEDDELNMASFQNLEVLANVIDAHLPVGSKKLPLWEGTMQDDPWSSTGTATHA